MKSDLIYLNNKEFQEEVEVFGIHNHLFATNTGRLYVDSQYANNYQVLTDESGEKYLYNVYSNDYFYLNKLQYTLFSEKDFEERDITLIYCDRDKSKKIYNCLQEYIKISDIFMVFLIDNSCRSFDWAIKRFLEKYYKIYTITQTAYSLLKPVFVRYKYQDERSLSKIRTNILNGNIVKEVVLYDVPCIIRGSKLELLKELKIDLSDNIGIFNSCYDVKCLSLGIETFREVRIEIKGYDNIVITMLGKGGYFK